MVFHGCFYVCVFSLLIFPTSLTAPPALTLTCLHPCVFCCKTNKIERPQHVCHNWSTAPFHADHAQDERRLPLAFLQRTGSKTLEDEKDWASNDSGTALSSLVIHSYSTICSLYHFCIPQSDTKQIAANSGHVQS